LSANVIVERLLEAGVVVPEDAYPEGWLSWLARKVTGFMSGGASEEEAPAGAGSEEPWAYKRVSCNQTPPKDRVWTRTVFPIVHLGQDCEVCQQLWSYSTRDKEVIEEGPEHIFFLGEGREDEVKGCTRLPIDHPLVSDPERVREHPYGSRFVEADESYLHSMGDYVAKLCPHQSDRCWACKRLRGFPKLRDADSIRLVPVGDVISGLPDHQKPISSMDAWMRTETGRLTEEQIRLRLAQDAKDIFKHRPLDTDPRFHHGRVVSSGDEHELPAHDARVARSGARLGTMARTGQRKAVAKAAPAKSLKPGTDVSCILKSTSPLHYVLSRGNRFLHGVLTPSSVKVVSRLVMPGGSREVVALGPMFVPVDYPASGLSPLGKEAQERSKSIWERFRAGHQVFAEAIPVMPQWWRLNRALIRHVIGAFPDGGRCHIMRLSWKSIKNIHIEWTAGKVNVTRLLPVFIKKVEYEWVGTMCCCTVEAYQMVPMCYTNVKVLGEAPVGEGMRCSDPTRVSVEEALKVHFFCLAHEYEHLPAELQEVCHILCGHGAIRPELEETPAFEQDF
jgi:hypothetical protein